MEGEPGDATDRCWITGVSAGDDVRRFRVPRHGADLRREGQKIFRHDTFGDEQFWTDVLRMHEVISTVDPATALTVGLKVDVDALPQALIDALRAGQVI